MYKELMKTRAKTLESLKSEPFDLLVIGGGATGAGVALDAANRGLKTALVERFDFASGTSSKSTKLLHGGVRYLEKAFYNLDLKQFQLVKDALKERALIFQNAPHLAKPLELIIPLYHFWEVPYYWAGIKFYDWIASRSTLPKSAYISREKIIQKIPTIQTKGLVGGISYFDGQFNDARLNISLILSAVEAGATALNYAEVIDLGKTARIFDHIDQKTFDIHAKTIINATGAFVDAVRSMDNPQSIPLIVPSSGTHILIDSSHMPGKSGLVIPKTKDGRIIFMLPWEGSLLVGTTDTPQPAKEDVEYLLSYAAQYLNVTLHPSSIQSMWSGLRPLVKDFSSITTENMVRDHFIEVSPSGLITITGGKWTTYRKMAEDVMQLVFPSSASTENLLLVGASGYTSSFSSALIREFNISEEIGEHLSSSYGTKAKELLEIEKTLNIPLVKGHPILKSEVVWALAKEMAQKPIDILARRTNLAFLDARAAEKALPEVVKIMQTHLGWTAKNASQEEADALNQIRRLLS